MDQRISELIESVGSEAGRQRLAAYLESLPFPHYEPVKGEPEVFIRVGQDGVRTKGRFVGREWVTLL